MKKSTETLFGVGLSASLVFSTAACGDKEVQTRTLTPAEREAEIDRLEVLQSAAYAALRQAQVIYEDKVAAVPADCMAVIGEFIPPGGELWKENPEDSVTEEILSVMVRQACGEDNTDIIDEFRVQFRDLQMLQGEYDGYTHSIAAHVSAAGVAVPSKS